jgi:hypothetical protein
LEVANEKEMAWGRGSTPTYIARWGEPQPLD